MVYIRAAGPSGLKTTTAKTATTCRLDNVIQVIIKLHAGFICIEHTGCRPVDYIYYTIHYTKLANCMEQSLKKNCRVGSRRGADM